MALRRNIETINEDIYHISSVIVIYRGLLKAQAKPERP